MVKKKKLKFRFPKLRKRTKRKVIIKKIIVKTKQKSVGQVLRERITRRKNGIQ